MIDVFQKFAANAKDYAVLAQFAGHEDEDLLGYTCLGWFLDEAGAEVAAERARTSLDCLSAVVIPKAYLLPALLSRIVTFDRVFKGEQFDAVAKASEERERYGALPCILSNVLLEPVINAVCERREQETAKQRAKTKQLRRRLPIQELAASIQEAATC